MGNSNGSALVNQLAIECRLPNIRSYVTGVSLLNVFQHDGRNFKAKGDDNNYQAVATPLIGKRLMNISGTDDQLIPYRGGPSPAIPAKGGKLGFVDAKESIFLWAKAEGYKGEKLTRPTKVIGKLEIFSYLDGDVSERRCLRWNPRNDCGVRARMKAVSHHHRPSMEVYDHVSLLHALRDRRAVVFVSRSQRGSRRIATQFRDLLCRRPWLGGHFGSHDG